MTGSPPPLGGAATGRRVELLEGRGVASIRRGTAPRHPAATVIATDLEAKLEDARLFTVSREDALARSDEGADVLRFREGDVGVQVQADMGVTDGIPVLRVSADEPPGGHQGSWDK